MSEKILTLHPEGKRGVNISRAKYEKIRETIIAALGAQPGMTFKALIPDVERRLGERFEGSVGWYVTTVKLDLEARGIVRRLPQQSPQRLILTE